MAKQLKKSDLLWGIKEATSEYEHLSSQRKKKVGSSILICISEVSNGPSEGMHFWQSLVKDHGYPA